MKEKLPKNFGLLERERFDTDYVMGGSITKIGNLTELQANGQWEKYLPKPEMQNSIWMDTYGCVTFSATNCLEILYKRKWNETINISDRFTVVASDTTPNLGNYFYKVADSLRKYDGAVIEKSYAWDRSREAKVLVPEYYKPLTSTLRAEGKTYLNRVKIQYEWVNQDNVADLLYALKYAPLQISVKLVKPVNGIYPRTNIRPNHAITLYGYKLNEYWMAFDHYQNTYKKLAWNFKFGAALKFSIEKIKQLDYELLKKLDGMYIMRTEANGEVYKEEKNKELVSLKNVSDY